VAVYFEDAERISARLATKVSLRHAVRSLLVENAKIGGRVEVPTGRVGFGLAPGKHPDQWRVAVRAWTKRDLASPELDDIERMTRGEVDIRLTGRISAEQVLTPSQLRRRVRPLRAGFSVGHHCVTAGTLGAFVSAPGRGLFMLSNNHVLANSNQATLGDPILQPGVADGGHAAHVVGSLHRFVPLQRRNNLVDAALASIDSSVAPTNVGLPGIGRVRGWWTAVPQVQNVWKVGRTTGRTSGRITALNVRNLPVAYGGRILRFDEAIEVQGRGGTPLFSDRGDSGSVVVDADRYAVGLLFAGDSEATYLNPIAKVLDALQASLVG
jgi:hypothetical protein